MSKPSKEFLDGIAVLRMCGYVSRQVYLEAIGHMEDKYPGRGWIEAMSSLEDWYSERALPLTEKGQGIFMGKFIQGEGMAYKEFLHAIKK